MVTLDRKNGISDWKSGLENHFLKPVFEIAF